MSVIAPESGLATVALVVGGAVVLLVLLVVRYCARDVVNWLKRR